MVNCWFRWGKLDVLPKGNVVSLKAVERGGIRALAGGVFLLVPHPAIFSFLMPARNGLSDASWVSWKLWEGIMVAWWSVRATQSWLLNFWHPDVLFRCWIPCILTSPRGMWGENEASWTNSGLNFWSQPGISHVFFKHIVQIFPGICGDAEPSKRQARGLHVEIVDMLSSRSFHSFEGSRCEKHHAERRTFDGVWSRNFFPQRKHIFT